MNLTGSSTRTLFYNLAPAPGLSIGGHRCSDDPKHRHCLTIYNLKTYEMMSNRATATFSQYARP